jgi:hypothetical protein
MLPLMRMLSDVESDASQNPASVLTSTSVPLAALVLVGDVQVPLSDGLVYRHCPPRMFLTRTLTFAVVVTPLTSVSLIGSPTLFRNVIDVMYPLKADAAIEDMTPEAPPVTLLRTPVTPVRAPLEVPSAVVTTMDPVSLLLEYGLGLSAAEALLAPTPSVVIMAIAKRLRLKSFIEHSPSVDGRAEGLLHQNAVWPLATPTYHRHNCEGKWSHRS